MAAPGGVLSAQLMEPIRVLKTLKAVSVNSPSLNVYVFDFGQNFAGWVRLNLKGSAPPPRTCVPKLNVFLVKIKKRAKGNIGRVALWRDTRTDPIGQQHLQRNDIHRQPTRRCSD